MVREGQAERDHLLTVANQEDVADEHRVIPGLAFHCMESRQFCLLDDYNNTSCPATVSHLCRQQTAIRLREGSGLAPDPFFLAHLNV